MTKPTVPPKTADRSAGEGDAALADTLHALRAVPDEEAPWRRCTLPIPPDADLWVFGYGSLMWNPEFDHEERRVGVLYGFHRQFCVYSHRYRGTPERPGAVLGLAPGGSCRGIVFRVAPGRVPATLEYLWQREMVTGVYRPGLRRTRLDDGRTVRALSFVADPEHPQFCGHLAEEDLVALICRGHGQRGPCCEYLFNTVAHLDELGITGTALHRLAHRVRQSRAAGV